MKVKHTSQQSNRRFRLSIEQNYDAEMVGLTHTQKTNRGFRVTAVYYYPLSCLLLEIIEL